MINLLEKYTGKLTQRGLAQKCDISFAALEAEVTWNRPDPPIHLEPLFDSLSISTLLSGRPQEPYRSILDALVRTHSHPLMPQDTETRTFLHDLPVARSTDPAELAHHLRRRKGVIAPGPILVTTGTVTPEQAYIVFSSMIHAAFVLYFLETLDHFRSGSPGKQETETFHRIWHLLPPMPEPGLALKSGPFSSEKAIYPAIIEAGERTVDAGLVDSYFGNISMRHGDTIFISQTGSSLEELGGCIDACPMDLSSCAGITASSELSAHRRIYEGSDLETILHGHPRFSVILSLDCRFRADCPDSHRCHTHCSRERMVNGIPVVSGEVGTGPFGLDRTMPPAVSRYGAAIVYGHGVFTAGKTDFATPFKRLLETENGCREEYERRLRSS